MCINLNTALLPHSHQQHVRLFQMPVCICYTTDCVLTPVQIDVLQMTVPW